MTIEELAIQINNIDRKIDRLDDRLDEMDKRLADIEICSLQMKNDLNTIDKKLDKIINLNSLRASSTF